MRYRLCPFVNERGKFIQDEEVDTDQEFIEKVKLLPSEIAAAHNKQGEISVDKIRYDRKVYAYEIEAGRRAEVIIYFDRRFNDHYQSGAKELALEDFAKDKAPWIFSYAIRKDVPNVKAALGKEEINEARKTNC